jgi:putative hydrolase of the HAD superfamily
MKKLQAIFFDIDNTLFPTSTFVREARFNSIKNMIQLGLKAKLEETLTLLLEVVSEFGSNDESHFKKLIKRLPPEQIGDINPAVLEAAGVVGYEQTKFRRYKPHEDVTEVLKTLSKSHLLLGILSNGRTIKQAEKLVRLGILDYLDPKAIFISEQIGMAKPNPQVFRGISEKFNIPPEEIMIVGDHPTLDIEPTRGVGMISVQNCRNIDPSRKHPGADYHINNFWDLLEILQEKFEIFDKKD